MTDPEFELYWEDFVVRSRSEALNQRGELVMTMEGWGPFKRRPARHVQ